MNGAVDRVTVPKGYKLREMTAAELEASLQWSISGVTHVLTLGDASAWFPASTDRLGYFIVLAADGWFIIDAVNILQMRAFKICSGPFPTAAGALLAVKVISSAG